MSKRTDKLLLTDIEDAIGKIEKYIGNLELDEFMTNDLVLNAVARILKS